MARRKATRATRSLTRTVGKSWPIARRLGPLLAAGLILGSLRSQAQTPQTVSSPAISTEEATRLATGWALLAQAKNREAADLAESLLSQFPRSPAALSLAVESVVAGRGAFSGLDVYERWLGNRTAEEPSVLARIARATLYEWARQNADVTARMEALKVLAQDGVPEAMAALRAPAGTEVVGAGRALVGLGDPVAIDRALARLKSPGVKAIDIIALGESRSPRVVAPLSELLADPLPPNRAEAATALGKIGQKDVVPRLTPLLRDANGAVKLAAAGALLRLGDFSGVPQLRELASSEYSAVRRTAAILLEPLPDDEWKAMVRALGSDPDPSFRLDAARLMARHDADFSQTLLESLMLDPNPEIREQAGVILAHDSVSPAPSVLRRLLRAGSGRVRVAAAARLMTSIR